MSKIKYAAGSIVICLEPNIGPEGDAMAAGDRVRADHPQVLRNPELFHVEGLTTKEIHELHQARFPGARE